MEAAVFVVVSYVRGQDGKLTPWLREDWTFSEVRVSDLRKAFSSRIEARRHADGEIEEGADEVEIYEVAGVDDARKAIDAPERGGGTLVEVRVTRATPKEIRQARLAESEDPVAEEAKQIARLWLHAYATEAGWLKLPAKRKVAKDKDAWLGRKYSTFGEALEALIVSSIPAHKFVMKGGDGEPWPFEPEGDETVRNAIVREASWRHLPSERLTLETEGDPEF